MDKPTRKQKKQDKNVTGSMTVLTDNASSGIFLFASYYTLWKFLNVHKRIVR
jgi:hypothetical protein